MTARVTVEFTPVVFLPGSIEGFEGSGPVSVRCFSIHGDATSGMVIDHLICEVSPTGSSFRFWRFDERKKSPWIRARTWRLWTVASVKESK